MIARFIDSIYATFSPEKAVRRQYARNVLRQYDGAISNRLNDHKKPKNQAADSELAGPFGADMTRAWARDLVRNNAWAWAALDSIVSETIGTGIKIQSTLEDVEGQDIPDTNENRDRIWAQWCEVCDINGQMSFDEMQVLAYREMIEAGECLIRMLFVPEVWNGIYRPVPLALELIEADRLASDRDTYAFHRREDGHRVVRGVELDETSRPVAYWVYPDHPTEPHAIHREPVRLDARDVLHLYRRDRIGQNRGISWFAPVISWMRDLGLYVGNELQASAVNSCFAAAITTDTPPVSSGAPPTTTSDTTDAAGNQYEYIQPGQIMYLRKGESITGISPNRPNSGAEPWIQLMLRGIAAGTGTSYEAVSKDFSNTSYSSSRTSKLENRARFRRGQQYWMRQMQRIWDRFCDRAAWAGLEEFPTMTELLADRRRAAPVEFMPPRWEWVDITAEQAASEASINAFQSTYADEIGGRGGNWRRTFKQRAKEEQAKRDLGLVSPVDSEKTANLADAKAAVAPAETPQPTGEMASASTLQFNRNRKAINKVLSDMIAGTITEARARAELSTIGLKPETIDTLIADALDDGQVQSMETVEAGA